MMGIVTNLDQSETFTDYYENDVDHVAKVLRTQVDVVLPHGVAVLNADDPLVAEMAPLCDGDVIFFGLDSASPFIRQHRDEGGRAVFAHQGQVVLAHGQNETLLTEIDAVPLTRIGQPAFQIQNVLAAAAAGWALGISPELIRAGIETFDVESADPVWENIAVRTLDTLA